MTRRTSLLFVSLLAAFTTRAAPGFDVQKIAEGVYAVVRTDPPGLMCDGNSAFIVNDEDVVVVDAPEATAEVIAAIRKVTSKPVRYVIDTHGHDDHITGNDAYRKSYPGVEIVGHPFLREYLPGQGTTNRKRMIENAPGGAAMLKQMLERGTGPSGAPLTQEEREAFSSDIALVDRYMATVPSSPIVPPTMTVSERLTLHRGERTIEILGLGAGHTGGDLVVFLPKERIAFAGDLVVWPVPLVGSDQSHVTTWSGALDHLVALRPAVIVPGHGPVLHDDAYPKLLSRLFASVTEQTKASIAKGEALEQARASIDLSEFKKALAGDSPVRNLLFAQYVAGPAVGAAYRELRGQLP